MGILKAGHSMELLGEVLCKYLLVARSRDEVHHGCPLIGEHSFPRRFAKIFSSVAVCQKVAGCGLWSDD